VSSRVVALALALALALVACGDDADDDEDGATGSETTTAEQGPSDADAEELKAYMQEQAEKRKLEGTQTTGRNLVQIVTPTEDGFKVLAYLNADIAEDRQLAKPLCQFARSSGVAGADSIEIFDAGDVFIRRC
jgi:hypothetical protein